MTALLFTVPFALNLFTLNLFALNPFTLNPLVFNPFTLAKLTLAKLTLVKLALAPFTLAKLTLAQLSSETLALDSLANGPLAPVLTFLNSEQPYILAIVALLPLTALMVVSQVNPYHALVMRGILGAVAALVYALLGAADVALTEALVGTMLSITLYAVAVRSSLTLRLGVPAAYLEQPLHPPSSLSLSLDQLLHRLDSNRAPVSTLQGTPMPLPGPDAPVPASHPLAPLLPSLQTALAPAHLRLEWVPYADRSALEAALHAQEIHGVTWILGEDAASSRANGVPATLDPEHPARYHLEVRPSHIYKLLESIPSPLITVTLTQAGSLPSSALRDQATPAADPSIPPL